MSTNVSVTTYASDKKVVEILRQLNDRLDNHRKILDTMMKLIDINSKEIQDLRKKKGKDNA